MDRPNSSGHLSLAPRAALNLLAPYSAGRDAAALRRDSGFTGTVVKLASNEGAEGPFPAANEAIAAILTSAHRYPDAYAAPLCAALAQFHRVNSDEVIVSNGGCALISHLSSAFLEVGDEVIFGRPTFHLYRLEALRMGAVPVQVAVKGDGSYDLPAMRRAIGPKTRLVYICTPNNPTGGMISRSELADFLDGLPPRVLPIVDEAYFEYVEHTDYADSIRIARPCERPVVVMRTFSKIYGLAGMRIGYAVAPPDAIASVRKIQNPYEVNRVSQAAALASLMHPDELARRRSRNSVARELLTGGLRALGLEPLPSQANFACVRVGDAQGIARALEGRGVIVRPLDAMGDPASIRITVGTAQEVDVFLRAFAAVLGRSGTGSANLSRINS
jgi:histidinol-phosphate aminotransferase